MTKDFWKLTCWFVFDEDLCRFTTLYLLLMKEPVLPTVSPCLSNEYLERSIFFGETFVGFFEYFNKCFGATAELWSLTNLYFDNIVTTSFLGTWVYALDWNALLFRDPSDFSALLKTRVCDDSGLNFSVLQIVIWYCTISMFHILERIVEFGFLTFSSAPFICKWTSDELKIISSVNWQI